MTFLNILLGIAALLFGIVLWAIGFAVFRLVWRVIVNVCVGVSCWLIGFCRDPNKTFIESNFFVHLIALPFLLGYEQLYKWIKPAEHAKRKSIIAAQNINISRREEILSRQGAECIYKEGSVLCCARIQSIEIDDTHHVRFTVSPIHQPGLTAPLEAWSCLVTWDNFYYDSVRWNSEYYLIKWRLYFNPELIQGVKTLASSLTELDEVSRLEALHEYLKKWIHARTEESVPLDVLAERYPELHSQRENYWLDIERRQTKAAQRPWPEEIAVLYEKLISQEIDLLRRLPEIKGAKIEVVSHYLYPNLEGIIIAAEMDDCWRVVLPSHPNILLIIFTQTDFFNWWQKSFPEMIFTPTGSTYAGPVIAALESTELAGLKDVFNADVKMGDLMLAGLWGVRVRLNKTLPEFGPWRKNATKDDNAGGFLGNKGDTGYVMTYLPYPLSEYHLESDAPVWVTTPWEVRGVAIPWDCLSVADDVEERVAYLKLNLRSRS